MRKGYIETSQDISFFMLFSHISWSAWVMSVLPIGAASRAFSNPILPGFNPDPSCTFVPEWDNTFLCTTSSFLTFPGAPVWASKDLVNWKLASHAVNRAEQVPELFRNSQQSEGIWASTIRYHDGLFYLITSYVSWYEGWGPKILLFTTKDPYDDDAWSDPIHFENPENEIDPDLFWDDDGKVYMSVARGIFIHEVDLATGSVLKTLTVWNGTGDRNPEGPKLYKKDGYYYLSISEGGTETNHSAVISRATSIEGPYEGYEGNPILTAKNTDSFFQTIGHTDFFQDASDNWWCVALATRSGPDWEVYPMGREAVLAPMVWGKGEWPVVDRIQGVMHGPLPRVNKKIPGNGPWATDGDRVDFKRGSQIPRHFLYWRPPKASLFTVSPPGHPNTLRISPSRVNLTADSQFEPITDGFALISRKQSSSIFTYTVDVSFEPRDVHEEAGLTVFLTQYQHIDISIIKGSKSGLKLKLYVEASGKPGIVVPEKKTVDVPAHWLRKPIRLSISANKDSYYELSAASTDSPHKQVVLGKVSAEVVSGGSGPFHGE